MAISLLHHEEEDKRLVQLTNEELDKAPWTALRNCINDINHAKIRSDPSTVDKITSTNLMRVNSGREIKVLEPHLTRTFRCHRPLYPLPF